MINTNKLSEIIEQLNELLLEMKERGIDSIDLRSNTYGAYVFNISIPGEGYLYIEDAINKIYEMEDYDHDNN